MASIPHLRYELKVPEIARIPTRSKIIPQMKVLSCHKAQRTRITPMIIVIFSSRVEFLHQLTNPPATFFVDSLAAQSFSEIVFVASSILSPIDWSFFVIVLCIYRIKRYFLL